MTTVEALLACVECECSGDEHDAPEFGGGCSCGDCPGYAPALNTVLPCGCVPPCEGHHEDDET
jgi:hypothetical protein